MSDDADATSGLREFRLVGEDSDVSELLKSEKVAEIKSDALELEDEFRTLYSQDKGIIEPPYNMKRLERLCSENNTLTPCIEAIVSNVAGTGYDFEKRGEKIEGQEGDQKIEELREFFREPWPGVSFGTILADVTRDREQVGNGYIEVLRNAKKEIVMFRHLDAKLIRLMRLDEPVTVTVKLMRGGKEYSANVQMRERRFTQYVSGKTQVYFREFGASRNLNAKTGEWETAGKPVPVADRATEIIHFKALPDATTPYGVPRWISQMPSALGSRAAEEYNLNYFENGGVPPAVIFLQGGSMSDKTRQTLETRLTKGSAAKKDRLIVVEVAATGGSLDQTPQSRVLVERFGAERQSDAMFGNYDESCSNKIRRAWRLPPIFVGNAEEYSFASAQASYTVAEAQVFRPMRNSLEEPFSLKVMATMGYHEYRLVLRALVIEDANLKLDALDMAYQTGRADLDDVVYEVNAAAGTNLKLAKKPLPPSIATGDGSQTSRSGDPGSSKNKAPPRPNKSS